MSAKNSNVFANPNAELRKRVTTSIMAPETPLPGADAVSLVARFTAPFFVQNASNMMEQAREVAKDPQNAQEAAVARIGADDASALIPDELFVVLASKGADGSAPAFVAMTHDQGSAGALASLLNWLAELAR